MFDRATPEVKQQMLADAKDKTSQPSPPSAIPPFLRAKLRAQQIPVVTPDQAPIEPGTACRA